MNKDIYVLIDSRNGRNNTIIETLNNDDPEYFENHLIINTLGDNTKGVRAFTDDLKSKIACIQVDDTQKDNIILLVDVPEGKDIPEKCKCVVTDDKATAMEKIYAQFDIGGITPREAYYIADERGGKAAMEELAQKQGASDFQKKAFIGNVRMTDREAIASIKEAPISEKIETLAAIYTGTGIELNGINVATIPNEMPKGFDGTPAASIKEAIEDAAWAKGEEVLINDQNKQFVYVGPEAVMNYFEEKDYPKDNEIGLIVKAGGDKSLTEEDLEASTAGISKLKEKLEVNAQREADPYITHDAVENDQTMGGDMVNALTGVGQAAANTLSDEMENAGRDKGGPINTEGKTLYAANKHDTVHINTDTGEASVVGGYDNANEETPSLDKDGDGQISKEEMDVNGDGKISPEEEALAEEEEMEMTFDHD